MPDHVLLVEDDTALRDFLTEVLDTAGYAVTAAASLAQALPALRGEDPLGVVVTDLVMPGPGGREVLAEVRRLRPELNVVVITAFGTIESAIELVKAGAYDYLTKPFRSDELLLTVERALEESRLRREVAELARQGGHALPGFIGVTRPMQELYSLIQRVASSSVPALVQGETGTGKELVARAIHRMSGRSAFVAVNCAALPENLLESELFGHARGAFTGADRDKAGLFETAEGGTLFLDEIGELPLSLQPKLLRALEEGEVRRVGAQRTVRVDVRIVAATNRDLEVAVRNGGFREDLYWRLAVVQVPVPSLRERPADVPLLAEHFLAGATGSGSRRSLTRAAMTALSAYEWPGNVRELRNAMERAATLAAGPEIDVADLPPRIRDRPSASVQVQESARGRIPIRELERRYILEVLRETDGNRSRAAEILGLDRKTLYRKLQEYQQDPESDPDQD